MTTSPTETTDVSKPSFAGFGLTERLNRALQAASFREPTPIQLKAIPPALEGKDVLGCAQTGTGKTAAFALPLLELMLRRGKPKGRPPIQILVLSPTRELASQIGASFRQFAGKGGPRHYTVFGGVKKHGQIQALKRGIDILVATPGRLLDLMDDGLVDFRSVQALVLDEADRMLDMGFVHDVRRIAKVLPADRQTLMFSATMPPKIRTLAEELLNDPVHVSVDAVASVGEPITQQVHFVEKSNKAPFLIELLAEDDVRQALVFTRTKHGANRLCTKLNAAGVEAAAIHGNKSQNVRERTLREFKAGKLKAVVATDVAARGIDIDGLSHVFNYDLPNEPESYVHRIGRTGRAGRTGTAVSFCSAEERAYLRDIERLTQQRIDRPPTPDAYVSTEAEAAPAKPAGPPRHRRRRRNTRRPARR